jgi:NAD(P)-dependent dehydrogenase (short-subunit alcohol dehydrogenase family)
VSFPLFSAFFSAPDRAATCAAALHDSRYKLAMSKVWLVTGSSRGLGRAIAKAVLDAGHRLVATARDPSELAFLASSDRLRTTALDVTDVHAARDAVAVATSAFGRLDVVVNNAGAIKANSIEDMSEDDFRRQMEVNFFGVYNVTRAALPVMHAQRDGHIIQISSIGGRRASPGLGAYQSAKWAVGGFSEVLAREVAPLGIRVTCVEPGGMRTDMFGLSMLSDPIAPDYKGTVEANVRATFGNPERARGNPAKVARAILQIAEEASPPLRLLIGTDAVNAAAAAQAARAEEDARWRALSTSTDFD